MDSIAPLCYYQAIYVDLPGFVKYKPMFSDRQIASGADGGVKRFTDTG